MNEPVSMPPDELMALYASGALPPDEAAALEARLENGWEEGERLWLQHEPTVAALLDGITPVAPPPELKAKLLASLPRQTTSGQLGLASEAHPPRGITFRHQREVAFVPTPYPGISLHMLHLDEKAGQFTALMKVDPGGRFPSHHHDGVEECLVLEGSLRVGDTLMTVGDYQRCEANSDHVEQWSDTGALLYLTAPVSMLLA